MAYLNNVMMNVKRKAIRATVLASLLTMFGSYAHASPGTTASTPQKTKTEYVVKKRDNLYNIAKGNLGHSPSIESIVNETDRIANLNGMGTIQEFSWHEDYDCSGSLDNDPNCIYPGQKLVLEQAYAPQTAEPAPDPGPAPYRNDSKPLVYSFLLGVAAGIGGNIVTNKRKNKKQELEDIIALKNEHPSMSISNLVEHIDYSEADFRNKIDSYFSNPDKFDVKIERYDHSIAPEAMKNDMVDMYQSSEQSLEEVSELLTEKYGMNVSASTISKYARKELKVDSRKEAREKYIEELSRRTSPLRQWLRLPSLSSEGLPRSYPHPQFQ